MNDDLNDEFANAESPDGPDDVDIPDPPDRVDVSGYSTAHGAAKATHEALQEWAEYMGNGPENVVFYDPDETRAKRDMRTDADVYTVAWEGGPSEWAVALTGGEAMTAFTSFGSFGGTPEVKGLTDGDGFDVECYYSFDIQFFNS